MAGRATPATLLLQREGVPHVLHAYRAGPGAYGPAGAAALGVAPERMLKTLLVELDGRLVCGVVPVSGSAYCEMTSRQNASKFRTSTLPAPRW